MNNTLKFQVNNSSSTETTQINSSDPREGSSGIQVEWTFFIAIIAVIVGIVVLIFFCYKCCSLTLCDVIMMIFCRKKYKHVKSEQLKSFESTTTNINTTQNDTQARQKSSADLNFIMGLTDHKSSHIDNRQKYSGQNINTQNNQQTTEENQIDQRFINGKFKNSRGLRLQSTSSTVENTFLNLAGHELRQNQNMIQIQENPSHSNLHQNLNSQNNQQNPSNLLSLTIKKQSKTSRMKKHQSDMYNQNLHNRVGRLEESKVEQKVDNKHKKQSTQVKRYPYLPPIK
eukprot:403354927